MRRERPVSSAGARATTGPIQMPMRSLRGRGYKSNYVDVESGAEFWISGCRKDGADRLYGERIPVSIDDDVRMEYWTAIRGQPERAGDETTS